VDFKVIADEQSSILMAWLIRTDGIEMSQLQLTLMTLLSIFLVVLLSVGVSLALVFPEIKTSTFIDDFKYIGLCFFAFEIILNFATKTYVDGRSINKLNEIGRCYL
jgi:hypothetical protein